MEYRKLIKFGNSSHVISVPNEWLKKNKLTKGDTIFLEENGHSELILMPEKRELIEEPKTVVIDTTNKTLIEIKREIVAAYINDINTIKLTGSEIINKLKDIRAILDNLVAIEIIEQTSEKIVAQDFLKIKDTSLEKVVRRVDTIIRNMMIDINLKNKNDVYESIISRDADINKLTFLAYRVIKKAFKNQSVAEEMNLSYTDLLNYYIIVQQLEELGDALKRVARTLRSFSANKPQLEDIGKLYAALKDGYEKLMKSYHTKDITLARTVADLRTQCLFECVKFGEKYQSYHANKMAEHFKDIHTCIGNIARVVYL